jgi:uncharacterized membrane protein YbhN (UPF0104 family)
MKLSYKIKIALRFIAIIAVFILLFYYLNDNYNNIRKYQFNIDKSYLFYSFIFLFIAILLVPIIWYLITKSFGCNLSLKESIYIRLISQMGKYLPGRILGYGYLIIHYKDAGIDKKRVINSSFYELLLSTISAFIFFTITMCFYNYEKLNEFRFIFILTSLLSIIAIHPYILQKSTNYVYKFFKKEELDCKIAYGKVIEFLFLYLFDWLIFGFAFFLFAKAFSPIPIDKIIYISGAFAVSTFAGFMAFFLPAGLGAREGMLIFILTSILGFVPTIIVAIGSRIWMIVGDSLLFVAALILSRFKKVNN